MVRALSRSSARGDTVIGASPGRAAQSLLRAAIGDVDAVLVHQHRHAAQRGDAIGDHQRVHFVRRLADRLRLVDTCRWRSRPARTPPRAGCSRRMKSRASCGSKGSPHVFASRTTSAPCRRAISPMRSPKKPLVSSANLRAGLGEVGHRRLHAGAAGAGHREVELVRGGVGIAQQRADLLRHLEEERIEVADDRLRHGLVHARSHHARTGPEEQAFRRL